MTTQQYVARCVIPEAAKLLPEVMDSTPAWAMLIAIGRQESGFRYRRQVSGRQQGETTFGPARGFWQFEMGGVEGVLEHHGTREHASAVLRTMGYSGADARMAHLAIEDNDVLACVFARLLLWADPRGLPLEDDPTQGWLIYLASWRPGHPHPHTWASNFANAWETEWPGVKRA